MQFREKNPPPGFWSKLSTENNKKVALVFHADPFGQYNILSGDHDSFPNDQGPPGILRRQCTPASPLGTGVTAVDDCGPDCNPALLDPVNGLLPTP